MGGAGGMSPEDTGFVRFVGSVGATEDTEDTGEVGDTASVTGATGVTGVTDKASVRLSCSVLLIAPRVRSVPAPGGIAL